MAAADVAGAVRAEALARRRLGSASARRLATHHGLTPAIEELAGTPYGRYVHPGQSLAEAEHATARTLLWHLRVLAGWQPRPTAEALRLLAGWFQLANLDEQVHQLAGNRRGPLFDLGMLATTGPRLADAHDPTELRAALAASTWGDPGAGTGRALSLIPRLAWLRRVAARLPATAGWASGAGLLLLAQERVLNGRPIEPAAVKHLRPLVGGCLDAHTLDELRTTADRRARWVLDGVHRPDDLWRAEIGWWSRVDREGIALLHSARFTGQTPIGCAAVLAADAWRVRAALESAALGGDRTEVFDAGP
jgi:hypothetical protein